MEQYVLTLIIFIPIVGMATILCLPGRSHDVIKWTALLFTVPPFFLGLWLYQNFNGAVPDLQFVAHVPWIPSYNINYFVGIDGVSISMVLLTVLLCPICIVASWGIERAPKGYFALFLLLDAAMVGVFCAMDFFLFYIFWELMLLPMYFLIGIWGGPRREYAAIKFFLYTMLGSVLMLVAMLVFYFHADYTFDLTKLAASATRFSADPVLFGLTMPQVLWLALFINFAVKIPAFPFHTWLPDAHVEAPTAISVILAGVLLKMGTYGILRVNYPLLPEATLQLAPYFLAALGAWNIVYGALCALGQCFIEPKDVKKLVAYSSISHMGYVMLGMASFTPQGINGAVLQMFNHGTITAMLFLIVGVIYDRAHHRRIDGFGGLASVMPVYTGIMALAFFAAMGLPGLSAFISEILVLLGAWQNYKIPTILGAATVILTAGYLLWTIQQMFLGKPREDYAQMHLSEINNRELFTLIPLGVIVVVLGVYPHAVLDLIDASLRNLNSLVLAAAQGAPVALR
ncbi:MAG: complex I subunit 4 family protein [Candidatus Binatia bacterium]